MRLMCWGVVMLAACAWGHETACAQLAGTATGCPTCNLRQGSLGAPACSFWGFGLTPGCCEQSPSCCDHVWDNYCARRSYLLQRHAARQAACPSPMQYGPVMYGSGGGYAPYGMDPGATWSEPEPDPATDVEAPDLPEAPEPAELPETT